MAILCRGSRPLSGLIVADRCGPRHAALRDPVDEPSQIGAEPRMVCTVLGGSFRRDGPPRHLLRPAASIRPRDETGSTALRLWSVRRKSAAPQSNTTDNVTWTTTRDSAEAVVGGVPRRGRFCGVDTSRMQRGARLNSSAVATDTAAAKRSTAGRIAATTRVVAGAREHRPGTTRPSARTGLRLLLERHQHDTFGEKLPDQSASAGANRQPHRHLVLARARAGEQQIRDVGAADKQHDGDDRHHDQQRLGVLRRTSLRLWRRARARYD